MREAEFTYVDFRRSLKKPQRFIESKFEYVPAHHLLESQFLIHIGIKYNCHYRCVHSLTHAPSDD